MIFPLSLRYGVDPRRRNNSDGTAVLKFQLNHVTPATLLCISTIVASKTEGVMPEHCNVCYVHYNNLPTY